MRPTKSSSRATSFRLADRGDVSWYESCLRSGLSNIPSLPEQPEKKSCGDTSHLSGPAERRGYVESRLCYTVAGASLGRRFDDVTGSRTALGAPEKQRIGEYDKLSQLRVGKPCRPRLQGE